MMDASVTVTVDSHGNLVRLPFPQALRRSGPMVSLMRIGRFHYWGVLGLVFRVQLSVYKPGGAVGASDETVMHCIEMARLRHKEVAAIVDSALSQ